MRPFLTRRVIQCTRHDAQLLLEVQDIGFQRLSRAAQAQVETEGETARLAERVKGGGRGLSRP